MDKKNFQAFSSHKQLALKQLCVVLQSFSACGPGKQQAQALRASLQWLLGGSMGCSTRQGCGLSLSQQGSCSLWPVTFTLLSPSPC